MPYHGHVQNGVVVLDEPASLPDGAAVTVLLTDDEAVRAAERPRRSLEGLWADLDVDISDEDIDSARRDMWGGFPREDLP